MVVPPAQRRTDAAGVTNETGSEQVLLISEACEPGTPLATLDLEPNRFPESSEWRTKSQTWANYSIEWFKFTVTAVNCSVVVFHLQQPRKLPPGLQNVIAVKNTKRCVGISNNTGALTIREHNMLPDSPLLGMIGIYAETALTTESSVSVTMAWSVKVTATPDPILEGEELEATFSNLSIEAPRGERRAPSRPVESRSRKRRRTARST